MPIFRLDQRLLFPPPHLSEPDGLLAVGGDLSPERLLLAYSMGIFPWYEAPPILWWSPPQRTILEPGRLKVSRRLARTIRQKTFIVTFDQAFGEVVEACATTPRKDQEGTWITSEMADGYGRLFEKGFAHSVECWRDRALAGGIYGVVLGKCFFGESMFHRATDASKVAMFHLMERLSHGGFQLLDCQLFSTHLASLGARQISRGEFLACLWEGGIRPSWNPSPSPF